MCEQLIQNTNDEVRKYNVMVVRSEILYLRRSLEFEVVKDYTQVFLTSEKLVNY
jgi:hypothetical protein